jgi:hypothetical protein
VPLVYFYGHATPCTDSFPFSLYSNESESFSFSSYCRSNDSSIANSGSGSILSLYNSHAHAADNPKLFKMAVSNLAQQVNRRLSQLRIGNVILSIFLKHTSTLLFASVLLYRFSFAAFYSTSLLLIFSPPTHPPTHTHTHFLSHFTIALPFLLRFSLFPLAPVHLYMPCSEPSAAAESGVIINTCGWIDGLGYELLLLQIKELQAGAPNARSSAATGGLTALYRSDHGDRQRPPVQRPFLRVAHAAPHQSRQASQIRRGNVMFFTYMRFHAMYKLGVRIEL